MDQAKRRTVRILDKDYQVNCPEGQEEALRQAAYYLDRKMRDIRQTGRVIGGERIAIMAGLNIAHELVGLQSGDTSYQAHNFEDRIQSLQQKIDGALSDVALHSKRDEKALEDALSFEAECVETE